MEAITLHEQWMDGELISFVGRSIIGASKVNDRVKINAKNWMF